MDSDPLGSFGLRLLLRLGALLLVLVALAWLLVDARYPIGSLLLGAIALAQVAELLRFVRRTNLELVRFLDSIRYNDFSQRFDAKGGSGFTELGATFTGLVEDFRGDRRDLEAELRHLRALLEHVPVPLITVAADETTQLWNNAARRLFAESHVQHLEDLAYWDESLPAKIRGLAAGARTTGKARFYDVEQTLALECGAIVLPTGTERLISLLNIQGELDDTQLDAWQELVRVLTHEIMNSLTPVTSLARTATDLLDDVRARPADDPAALEELADAREAVDTVARRADGLMGFVTSYRTFTRLPDPERSRFDVGDLLREVQQMADAPGHITVRCSVEPGTLQLYADRQMIFQVLINLLRNAIHALDDCPGEVTVLAEVDGRDAVRLRVVDTGPGVPEDIAAKIFVPFFTTRRDGTGVGLAFSRRVMVAHGGAIRLNRPAQGGAEFVLVFPA